MSFLAAFTFAAPCSIEYDGQKGDALVSGPRSPGTRDLSTAPRLPPHILALQRVHGRRRFFMKKLSVMMGQADVGDRPATTV